MKKTILCLFLTSAGLMLAACGGGGGGGGGSKQPLPPQGSSDWDEMVWNQDDWA